jgi:arylsulfatase A-like enzyme
MARPHRRTPKAYNHYAVGWAHAMCTPYQWTKQVASHWGGTRNGTIVAWPNGFADKGTTRNQFHHVIDIAPTILEAAGLPAPLAVNGIQQAPLEGVSMLATLRDGSAPETHVVLRQNREAGSLLRPNRDVHHMTPFSREDAPTHSR